MSQLLSYAKFGNGHDGSPAVSGVINTYATCTGTAGQSVLTTSLSASDGDIILIHQSQHATAAGTWELIRVSSDAGATLNLSSALTNSYTTGAQAVLIPQYTGGNLSDTVTGTAWDGTVGGIIALMSNGTLTINGSLTASSIGFRGGGPGANSGGGYQAGVQGESQTSYSTTRSTSANSGGGGGGGANEYAGGAGGGGYSIGGTNGEPGNQGSGNWGVGGTGGGTYGIANLTTMTFGSAGGGGGAGNNPSQGGNDGAGGGSIFVFSKEITIIGSIVSNGSGGQAALSGGSYASTSGGGGGGAGGSILIKTQTGTLGTNLITAAAGSGGAGNSGGIGNGDGGAGGAGRIHLDYYGAYTGTTTPTLDVAQDTTLTPPIHGGMI